MNRAAQIIRIATAPPFMAMLLATAIYVYDPTMIGGPFQYIALLIFLTLLPLLAYPLQRFIPRYKQQGREGQRNLAFIASVLGYGGGVIFAALTAAPKIVHIIYWTYFLSVALLTLFNKATKWKASGHACGVAGPVISLIYFIGPRTVPVALIFAFMCWASIRMKRHTPAELVLGGLDSALAFALVLLVVGTVM